MIVLGGRIWLEVRCCILHIWSKNTWQQNGKKQNLGCSMHAYVGQLVRVNVHARIELRLAECLFCADPDMYSVLGTEYKDHVFGHLFSC